MCVKRAFSLTKVNECGTLCGGHRPNKVNVDDLTFPLHTPSISSIGVPAFGLTPISSWIPPHYGAITPQFARSSASTVRFLLQYFVFLVWDLYCRASHRLLNRACSITCQQRCRRNKFKAAHIILEVATSGWVCGSPSGAMVMVISQRPTTFFNNVLHPPASYALKHATQSKAGVKRNSASKRTLVTLEEFALACTDAGRLTCVDFHQRQKSYLHLEHVHVSLSPSPKRKLKRHFSHAVNSFASISPPINTHDYQATGKTSVDVVQVRLHHTSAAGNNGRARTLLRDTVQVSLT
ncbi:hypothetical protein PM082_011148 [Marasmius tenuissimus]|nr:hypothetical protein PM082_011148 [Marasmius tenuissimus]